MTFSIWLSLLTISILGAASPGPSLAVVVKNCLAGGRKQGLATAWAHAMGIGFYAVITLLGLAYVLEQSPLLFKTLSYAGAAYLLYMAINALRSKGGMAASLKAGEPIPTLQCAKEGLLISLLNPKIGLFYLALFSQFVSVGNALSDKAIIVLTPLLVDGLWYTLVTLLLSNPLFIDAIKRKALLIDRLSGVFLLFLAVRVVVPI